MRAYAGTTYMYIYVVPTCARIYIRAARIYTGGHIHTCRRAHIYGTYIRAGVKRVKRVQRVLEGTYIRAARIYTSTRVLEGSCVCALAATELQQSCNRAATDLPERTYARAIRALQHSRATLYMKLPDMLERTYSFACWRAQTC